MEHLPEELLIIIFEYCSLEDLQSIRLTCKLFYQVGTNKQLIKNEVLSIGSKLPRINNYKALLSPDCLRKFYICSVTNIVIENEKSYFIFQNLINKFCGSFRELYISKCSIPYVEFMRILKQSVNLKILKIHFSSAIFVENLSLRSDSHLFTNNLLKQLNISHCYSITDNILCSFFKMYPNLDYLSINSCVINTHGGIYSKYYRISSPVENPSDLVFTYQCVRDLISQSQNNITGLNLSGTILNNQFLKDICSNPNLKLKILDVGYCYEIKWNKIINDIVGKLTNLTYINLSATNITDEVVNIICSESRNLIVLIISKCEEITDAAFENLIYLQYLEEFDVGECFNVTSEGILSKLQTKINSKSLRKLNMSSVSFENCKISDYTLVLSQLIKFDVSKCTFPDITDLKSCFSIRHNIQVLSLSGISLPNEMFIISNSTENLNNQSILLKKLNNAINRRTDFSLANIFNENTPHKNKDDLFYNLKTLNLESCKFTDKIFEHGFYFINLKNLNLLRTVLSIKGILLLILKCPFIQSLDVSYTNVDDVFVNVIVQGLKKLRYLNLKNCEKITNGSLDAISKYSTTLKTLNVGNCLKLSLTGISKLHSRIEIEFRHS